MRSFAITMVSAAAFFSAGTAHAVTVFPTQTVSGGSASVTGPTDYNQQIGSLSLFNTNVGQLVGVTVNVGYSFNSSITVSAPTNATGSVSTESAAKFLTSNSVIASVFNRVINNLPAYTLGNSSLSPTAFDLTGNTSAYSLSAGASRTFNSASQSSRSYSLQSEDFSAFLAGNQSAAFDVFGQTLTGLNLTATGGNASTSQFTVASQNISVLYTFIPSAVVPSVPEPSTWVMLLVGFAMVGGAARYRRRGTKITYA